MRRLVFLVVAVLAIAGCASGKVEADNEGLDPAGINAAAIQYVLGASGLSQKHLVYVAGPSVELWDSWCHVATGEPGEDVHDENPTACGVLDTSSFDLPAVYPAGSDAADEIEGAFSPAEVEFIEDPESVIEPFEEGMMIAPVQNDAGLVTFGVPIEAEGRIYLPTDAHGSGWLFELTPSAADEGWDLTPIAAYAV